ncbi:fatty acyl-CoA reductase 1-like isoform X2 [Amblyomma americanum]
MTALSSCRSHCCIVNLGSEQQQPSPPTDFVTDGNGDSQVARFYQDRAVFLTGGTGFIGKVLLEKLLRSCPGLKRVYLLIRTKRGEEPQARLATILSSQVFERLKQEQPSALQKVTAVPGDIALPSLGLSASDRATLVEEVSVVFHSAATVRFEEPLKVAFQLNVLATRSVLDLCKQIRNLCAFVHVSTAYTNCEKIGEVHEMIYEPCVDIETVNAAAQCTEDKSMGNEDEFLFGMPNTYTLTKRLAEVLLRDEQGSTPVAIVRPSIVTASWKEPFPGWIDNYAAVTGLIASVGTGLLPSMLVKKDCIGDYIPVDIVASTLICVAWHTAITRSEYVRVYHCTSGASKSQTWGDMTTAVQEAVLRYPMPYVARYPKFAVTSSGIWYNANLWCLHCLPAFVGDLALQLMGQKPRFIQRYRKVRKRMDIVRYFTTHGWLFRSNNVKGLASSLSLPDKKLFSLGVQDMDWRPYWDQYVLGIRKFLFKGEDGSLPDARRQLKRLYAVHLFLRLPLLILMSRMLMTETASKLGYSSMTTATRLWKTLPALWPL